MIPTGSQGKTYFVEAIPSSLATLSNKSSARTSNLVCTVNKRAPVSLLGTRTFRVANPNANKSIIRNLGLPKAGQFQFHLFEQIHRVPSTCLMHSFVAR